MRGGRWLLGAGEFLVGLAARRLPAAVRDERRREWEAELPVILGDPEVKPAAARAARMLSFAADTLRGSALRPGPGPARYRGAHRGAVTWGKDDFRSLGVGVALLTALLTMLAALLAGQAYSAYYLIFDNVSLAGYLTFVLSSLVLSSLTFLAGRLLLLRRSACAYCSWLSVATLAAGTGPHVSALAGHLGWGHPLPFTLISVCGYAVGAACITMAMAGVIGVKSIRQDLRSGSLPGQRGDRIVQRLGVGVPACTVTSSAEVGSSRTTTPGRSTSARAIATR